MITGRSSASQLSASVERGKSPNIGDDGTMSDTPTRSSGHSHCGDDDDDDDLARTGNTNWSTRRGTFDFFAGSVET